ncbi:matrix metalloproteinase-17 isoform X1 [Hemiscyllium ocellatum]|uniref:matrix metalloproteinase-17 isoform X1 n=1 Tax=Hemiscyllium ocellatum TaxID=170820 RepID=UPI002965F378|nr:matrix metalloproteinase-17 isoform X1 [Hemiscyllium ocellatum]
MLEMVLSVLLLLMSYLGTQSAPAPSEETVLGIEWLTKFGYLAPLGPATDQRQTQEALTKAIKAMQRFGGLEINGLLDQATVTLMKTPRCSLPDIVEPESIRRKRSLQLGTKWNKRNISWRVRTFPTDSRLGHDTIRALMYYALKVWSDIAPLNFHEVAGDNADILIDFTKSQHNDQYPFDGPGGSVAHAFLPGDEPIAGDVHFDNDEAWTFRSSDPQKMDLFAVAVHEFGHAIGLTHSSVNESIMRPYYQGPVGDPLQYHLPYDDRLRIWQIYGVRELLFPTSQVPLDNSSWNPVLPVPADSWPTVLSRPDVPDRCNTNFDAVAQIRGEAFFFKGRYFWRLTRNRHLVSLQPAEIQRFWRGLPSNMEGVDSVYERTGDHKIVFFKGERYWVFKDNNVEESYPRFISDFDLSVKSIDAAFVCPHDDKTYFFKDNQYWRYDDHLRRMDPDYPKDMGQWQGLPSQLDDAMKWSDGAAYFFKGKDYWKVTHSNMQVDPGYPKSVARDWLVCSEMQADSSISEHTRSRARTGRGHHDESQSGDEKRNCSCTSKAGVPRAAIALSWKVKLAVSSVVLAWLALD